jgi:hypothetical protein
MTLLDDIGAHMGRAGSIERAAVVPGIYFAWCANLALLDRAFQSAHERDVLRLRMRDMTPGEFFVKATGGNLRSEDLSERGRLFAEDHYADYPREFAQALGLDDARVYEAKDSWDTYDAVAKRLTAAYYAFADAGHKPHAKRRHWWQVWR